MTGPLHAGTYGPNELDNTFGPQVKFSSVPPGSPQNIPPTTGLQFFGRVKIAGESQVMTVAHYNLDGKKVYSVDLPPEK